MTRTLPGIPSAVPTHMYVKQCVKRSRKAIERNQYMPFQQVIVYLADRVDELERAANKSGAEPKS